ncbi:MAG: helix-turn-helix domain-containing protein [Pseudomonadota bacterium]
MTKFQKYSFAMGTDVVCRILQIDPDVMLQEAGLSHLVSSRNELRITAQEYFAGWNTVDKLTGGADYLVDLGIMIARGPVIPVFFAFACAPNLETGVLRLSHYKTLLGPTVLRSYWKADELCIEINSNDPSLAVPDTLAALHFVVLVEQFRIAIGDQASPISATLKATEAERRKLESYLGIMPEFGEVASLSFEKSDAAQPFISENPVLWESFEIDLQQQLSNERRKLPIKAHVRSVLISLMAPGRANMDDVCFEMNYSRSTLQRRLRDDGSSFRELLDETRHELAIRYLTNSELRVDEIGAMLGYRDANSFSRSFRKWKNQSPSDFRSSL